MTATSESEPHRIIPSVAIELNFICLDTHDPATWPDVRRGKSLSKLSVDVMFVVDGLMHTGYYHSNGCFYPVPVTHMIYVGGIPRTIGHIDAGMKRRKEGDVKDGQVTHWCYWPPAIRHPKLIKP